MGKKGGIGDSRGALIFSFVDVLKHLRPKSFLFENVPNFATIEQGAIARKLNDEFRKLEYSLWSGTLCAADFGAFTFRRRYFVIGIQGSQAVMRPEPTHTEMDCGGLLDDPKPGWLNCGRLFQQIMELEFEGRSLTHHEPVKHSEAVVQRFNKLAPGETDNIRKRNRLDPNRPAHSVYVGGVTGKRQSRSHIHPFLPRELTARECAAIQGFPLDWKFAGASDAAMLQAANAVPVELGTALALHMVGELRLRLETEHNNSTRVVEAGGASDVICDPAEG